MKYYNYDYNKKTRITIIKIYHVQIIKIKIKINIKFTKAFYKSIFMFLCNYKIITNNLNNYKNKKSKFQFLILNFAIKILIN